MTRTEARLALESAAIEAGDTVVVIGDDLDALVLGALESSGDDGAVIVVDPSPGELEDLRSRWRDPRLSLLVGDARVVPLPDGFADAVVATGEADPDELARVRRRARG